MSALTIGGICVACVVFLLFCGLALAALAGVVIVVRKSKANGVKFADGVSKDEWSVVKDAVAETLKSQELMESLKSISDLVTQTIVQKTK